MLVAKGVVTGKKRSVVPVVKAKPQTVPATSESKDSSISTEKVESEV
jgi:hypothetical protein